MHTWNVLRHVDLGHWHLSSILLDVLQSPVVDLTELRSLLLQLDVEKRMLLREVQRIVGRFGVVDWLGERMVMSQFGAVLVMVVMMIVMIMMILMTLVALFSHLINNIKMLISHYQADQIQTENMLCGILMIY